MKRATITMDGSGRVAVPSDIANVWMSEMELVTLFDVIAPTLRAAVRAVYRSGVLQSCEVERRIRLPNGYYLEVYALPMVMALAFRINTSNAARVRNVLLERLCLRKECGCVSLHPCTHTIQVCPKKYHFPLLRASSFRLLMTDIVHLTAFSYPSVSFAPFCIVLHIKVLAVLP